MTDYADRTAITDKIAQNRKGIVERLIVTAPKPSYMKITSSLIPPARY